MNPARVAQLLRELAAEFDGGADVPEPPKSRPRKRRRAPLPVVQHPEAVSDLDRHAARTALRRAGFIKS